MKLFFHCPITNKTFDSMDYALQQGHRIIEDEKGNKTLQGMVTLTSPCPLCGELHRFAAKDVLCPLSTKRVAE